MRSVTSAQRGFLRFFGAFLTLCTLFTVAACGTVPTSTSTSARGATIGFVGVGKTEDSEQAETEEEAVQSLRAAGMRVDYVAATSLDPMVQIEAVSAMAAKKVSAIVLVAQASVLWTDTFAAVHNANIPLILFDRTVEDSQPSLYSAYVGPSYYRVGTLLGDWAVRNSAEVSTPSALLVQSPLTSSVSSAITFGWAQASSAAFSTQKIVGSWDQEGAQAIISKALNARTTLPTIIVTYNSVLKNATKKVLAKQGIELAQVPTPGKVCLLSVAAGSENTQNPEESETSAYVQWKATMDADLVKTVKAALSGKALQKNTSVDVQLHAPLSTQSAESE